MRMRTVVGLCVLTVSCALVPVAAGPQQWKDALKSLGHSDHSKSSKLPVSDIGAGLKEALAKGTTHAINSLGRDGGFWNNAAVRIPLPKTLKQVGKLARTLGQGKKVDAFELSLNRAAEKAVPEVADIFGNAIRHMTLEDVRGILAGGDHAATDFFRRVAGKELAARIEPIVAKATNSVGVTRKYNALVSGKSGGDLGGALGLLGGGKDDSHGNKLDLNQYVTDKTMDGLFATIGDEEKSIRNNPAARTSSLLKKVFGGK